MAFNFSETVWGVIIGGAVAVVSATLPHLFSYLSAKAQRKHEIRIHLLNVLETQRLKALQDYMEQVGVFLTQAPPFSHTDAVINAFLSAHHRAVLFVSDDTVDAMNKALPIILPSPGNAQELRPGASELQELPEIKRLMQQMRYEMRRSEIAYKVSS